MRKTAIVILILLAVIHLLLVSACTPTIHAINNCGKVASIGQNTYDVHFDQASLDTTVINEYKIYYSMKFYTKRPDTLKVGELVYLSRMAGR